MRKTKTFLLMLGLVFIFVYVGKLIGGVEGMRWAFVAACGINFFSYFFSDKLVLKHYRATEVNEKQSPELYAIVKRLSANAGLPMPKVYIIPERVPNAFATGRNPKHAAVAATQGLLELMTPQEIEGVLAHEMSHVKHYDILISSVAAVFAGAIASLGNFARMRGGNNNRSNGLFLLLGTILMPIAATIVQMSISRTREYAADEGAANLTKHPEWLMSALSKLENYARDYKMQNANSQTAHMFIINPFSGLNNVFSSLFSTHPSTSERIKKLAEIKRNIDIQQ